MNRPSQGRCESTPTFILSFFIFVPQIGSTKQIKQDRSSIQTASDNVSIDGLLISFDTFFLLESNMKERRQRDGNPILQQICYVAVLPLSRFNHPPSLLRSTLGHVSSPLPNYACLLLLSTIRTRSTVDAKFAPQTSSSCDEIARNWERFSRIPPPRGVSIIPPRTDCFEVYKGIFPYFSFQTYYSRKQVCARCIRNVGLKHEQRVFNAYL